MIKKFEKYYQKNELFAKTDKILLTVSGGRDSVAMVYLFKAAKLNFGIAHCNFQLRGKEADKDEELVNDIAEKFQIPFYSIIFNTKAYATEKRISIQMAARELRYAWFEKIRKENNFQFIATAHHQNDVAETMLINLTKGTGLSGLHGISIKSKFIIRPMLCFCREEIDDYINKNNIIYREDQSNTDTKYYRNAIRHQIIPELEKLNPSIITTLNKEATRFFEIETILEEKINSEKEKCFEYADDSIKIYIKRLKNLNSLKTYLYYFLKDFDFNFSDVEDIINGLDNQAGKTYYSSTHILVKDRDFFILKRNEEQIVPPIFINSFEEFPFDSHLINSLDNFKINSSSNYAYLDADKIQFPLILRIWATGDFFKPFGMKGSKKISDYLIDKKVSIIDKKKIKVLADDKGQIIWLVGYRINDNFKITLSTRTILLLSVKE
ncbi:MAG: tRNA lysidine(34) synthetase TilS [Flavobacteriales bacterium CG_4_10_14_0_2_um_filter_32_8]|nr:MAG: tRNA lysidine(34) synthetase TilS [Flavobacteriales bacterium CG_4_10_14_0_2_um_filter_32_8]PJB14531.1 MAG: tRNA lysidine(34) synthetase TilS [Flavobacteriales bacterium CG_4_9_14_3_um_filter_32_8]